MAGERGQTNLDFAVGMSTFLLVVVFALTFVPSILQPFTASSQEDTVVVDRVADQLTGGMLADPGESATPYMLGVECTTEFFKTNPTGSPDCAFDQSAITDDQLAERVRVGNFYRVNVQMRGDMDRDGTTKLLCNDGSNRIIEQGGGCSSPAFEIGRDPPEETGSGVVARRVVSIDGRDATLLVEVW